MSPSDDDFPGFRRLPHNVEAERALLGALFLDNDRVWVAVGDFLEPDHFALLEHQRIYAAAADFIRDGKTANPTTLQHLFSDLGLDYLQELTEGAVVILNAGEYGRVIKENAQYREIIAATRETIGEAFDAKRPPQEILADGSARLLEVADAQVAPKKALWDEILEGVQFVATGLRDLDREAGGLARDEVTILAARPGMGKTALANAITMHVAGNLGMTVIDASLEMSRLQRQRRHVAMVGNVPLRVLRRLAWESQDQYDAAQKAAREVGAWPIRYIDSGAVSVSTLRIAAQKAISAGETLGLVVVDHIRFLKPSKPMSLRAHEIGATVYELKQMAQDLHVPVLALCQLNRGSEPEGTRPDLGRLRDSGEIEENVHNVWFLHREYVMAKHQGPRAGEDSWEHMARLDSLAHKADLYCRKARDGQNFDLHLRFDGTYVRFGDA